MKISVSCAMLCAACATQNESAEESMQSLAIADPMYGIIGRPIKIVPSNLFSIPTPESVSSEELRWIQKGNVWSTHTGISGLYWSSVGHGSGFTTTVSEPCRLTGKILIVGDSITAKGFYVQDLFERTGLAFLGTQQFRNVRHEGWPGYTFKRFYTDVASPFFLSGKLDVHGYLESIGLPDVILWFLGTNDLFARQGPSTTKDFYYAGLLRSAFQVQLPGTRQFYIMLPPGNGSQDAWNHDYRPPYNDMAAWREKWFEWNFQLYSNVPTIPAHMVIDPVGDYPRLNALHPNREGHRALADVIYAYLCAQADL